MSECMVKIDWSDFQSFKLYYKANGYTFRYGFHKKNVFAFLVNVGVNFASTWSRPPPSRKATKVSQKVSPCKIVEKSTKSIHCSQHVWQRNFQIISLMWKLSQFWKSFNFFITRQIIHDPLMSLLVKIWSEFLYIYHIDNWKILGLAEPGLFLPCK